MAKSCGFKYTTMLVDLVSLCLLPSVLVLYQRRIGRLIGLSCLFFFFLCRLGMNPNPSTPVIFTMLAPVIELVLSFSSSLSSPLFRSRSTIWPGCRRVKTPIKSTHHRHHSCRSVERPAVFPTLTPSPFFRFLVEEPDSPHRRV
jgi:hypothetical protein